jgi:hypothetical protein
MEIPLNISSEPELDEILSRPTKDLVKMISGLDGDILFLGVAGKIGVSMAIMAKRAVDLSGKKKRVIGLSRFSQEYQKKLLEKQGIEIIQGDLIDPEFVKGLPKIKNIFFLAGMKFGAEVINLGRKLLSSRIGSGSLYRFKNCCLFYGVCISPGTYILWRIHGRGSA